MTSETKRRIQLLLLAAIALAALRAGYIFYQRHNQVADKAKTVAPPLNADYYVTPRKLHPYDLESAKQLEQQPVWVKVGYSIAFYPYDLRSRRSDFKHQAGTLLPLQRLEIKDVLTDVTPGAPDQRQIMATFEEVGKNYAFLIGSVQAGNYQIYSDDMLFIQDPHDLYKHWPADVWQSIDAHQVKPGMSELQADFAIGLGVPEGGGSPGERTLNYPNGGKPLRVTFRGGKAAEINPPS